MRVCAIRRHPVFSPNSVEKDRAILGAVTDVLASMGHDVTVTGEDGLCDVGIPRPDIADSHFDLWLSMGRMPETLEFLRHRQLMGERVVNSPDGVENCRRDTLQRLMAVHGIPAPGCEGDSGYWVKRADVAAQSRSDVVYAASRTEADSVVADFQQRGIADMVVQAHVPGDVVKFYGVRSTGFFRFFYPADDGDTKFGDELVNGAASHFPFDADAMHGDVERLALLTGLEVYGGDCIVGADWRHVIIDFNDWPSFSRCRDDAAQAIVARLAQCDGR